MEIFCNFYAKIGWGRSWSLELVTAWQVVNQYDLSIDICNFYGPDILRFVKLFVALGEFFFKLSQEIAGILHFLLIKKYYQA